MAYSGTLKKSTDSLAFYQDASKPALVESNNGPRKIKSLPSRQAHNTRDDMFWYSDGNIIVQAGVKIFKLHAFRLKRYCVYFEEMIDLDGGVAKRLEGCPLYKMPGGVTAEGFKALLHVVEVPLYVAIFLLLI